MRGVDRNDVGMVSKNGANPQTAAASTTFQFAGARPPWRYMRFD
jgi:hypothetical protein